MIDIAKRVVTTARYASENYTRCEISVGRDVRSTERQMKNKYLLKFKLRLIVL
jgi:hypothetical protein